MSPKSSDSRPLVYQLSWRERILSWVGTVIVFAFFILYVFEFPRFGNIFQVKNLLFYSLSVLGIIGAVIGFFVSHSEKDLNERMKVFLFIFLTALFFAPLFGSLSNRTFAKNTEIKSYEVFEVELIGPPSKPSEISQKPRNYFIYVFEDDILEKIRLDGLTEAPQKGEQIKLEIKEGLFGWKFIAN